MKAAFLGVAVLAAAGAVFYLGTAVHAAKVSGNKPASRRALASTALSLPLFFEPNQGQTAPQVKFLARGAGYGLFLTADEAVLQLQHAVASPRTATAIPAHPDSSVIRMRLEGASSSPRVAGASPLPGKSNYFIGNDPAKWRRNIPQFARVQYKSVYPGVDLVYYGDQGQLEYDFRVAPAGDPKQIALNFQGASAHIVSGGGSDSGDLILSTADGNVRFYAPHIYQQDGNTQKPVVGGFRQLADNKIGFTIGDYDHSRELVIDPVLSYSSYLGGSGTEGGLIGGNPLNLVKVAIDSSDYIYIAGSTTSTDFPLPASPPASPPIQSTLTPGAQQNIFIAVINTNPNVQLGQQQLVYATYLGGSKVDSLAGIAVDARKGIYIAGSTTSPDFPTDGTLAPFQATPLVAGTHGFLSTLTLGLNSFYTLTYSTYLAGNGTDHVTGLAVDSNQNAYVTGDTTSSNPASDNFPANPKGYQTASNNPGGPQFFASQISTIRSGSSSMLYSSYFGGGYPTTATAIGGGIAVDPSGTSPSMYITGTTTMLGDVPVGEVPFPLIHAQQSCLNEASQTNCTSQPPTTTPDAFVAKINPSQISLQSGIYSTYIGGSGDDFGNAIAVDTSGNAYVTGATDSSDWLCSLGCLTGFQPVYNGVGGNTNAFIVKIGNITGLVNPLTYFTYLGGSGPDSGQDIKVDSVQAAHVVGSTLSSTNFPLTEDALQQYGGSGDAFVALISTTLSGAFPTTTPLGDYSTYLGGSGLDQGTGIALDNTFGTAYVVGITQSPNFPTVNPLPQNGGQLNGPQDAFVSKIGATSTLNLAVPSTSPSPNPVAAGNQVAFTFNITNMGTDPANQVVFNAQGLPTVGVTSVQAKVTSGGIANCDQAQGSEISCFIPTLAVNATASVEIDMTPTIPVVVNSPIVISGNASANGGPVGGSVSQVPGANVVDFGIAASPATQTISAGDTATFQVIFTPTSNLGYNATITPSQTPSPTIVTATAPVFNPTSVTLSGSGSQPTTLTIVTVPRPVPVGSLLHRGSFYATWLPIGGLSLVGLGVGASRKRRRWLAGAVLGLIAGIILLQPGCGSASTSTTTPGGTQAGTYIITIAGSAGSGASHNTQVDLIVN